MCAYLSSAGNVTQFPRIRQSRVALLSNKKCQSFREKFSIGKKVSAQDWVKDIYDAFPFLKDSRFEAGSLMYLESQIMVTTLLALSKQDIPAYPIHDCLLCKEKDKAIVVAALQKAMIEIVGSQAYMDIEYVDKNPEIVEPDPCRFDILVPPRNYKYFSIDWGIQDEDDFDVLEDY